MIIDDDNIRLKITDSDGDSVMVHTPEPDGEVVVTCHNGAEDEYAACVLNDHERRALIRRLGGRPVDDLLEARLGRLVAELYTEAEEVWPTEERDETVVDFAAEADEDIAEREADTLRMVAYRIETLIH